MIKQLSPCPFFPLRGELAEPQMPGCHEFMLALHLSKILQALKLHRLQMRGCVPSQCWHHMVSNAQISQKLRATEKVL